MHCKKKMVCVALTKKVRWIANSKMTVSSDGFMSFCSKRILKSGAVAEENVLVDAKRDTDPWINAALFQMMPLFG